MVRTTAVVLLPLPLTSGSLVLSRWRWWPPFRPRWRFHSGIHMSCREEGDAELIFKKNTDRKKTTKKQQQSFRRYHRPPLADALHDVLQVCCFSAWCRHHHRSLGGRRLVWLRRFHGALVHPRLWNSSRGMACIFGSSDASIMPKHKLANNTGTATGLLHPRS